MVICRHSSKLIIENAFIVVEFGGRKTCLKMSNNEEMAYKIALCLSALTILIGSAPPAAEDPGSRWALTGDLNRISNDGELNICANDHLYSGNPKGNKVIFRLDDVSVRRSSLTAAQEIVELFNKSSTFLDVGIIPYENGTESYRIPFLKPYIKKRLFGLSIHGYGHTAYEFDTTYSNRTEKELSGDLSDSLICMEDYFGKRIVSFTVPYDVFDEKGFNAVSDAGFKIFSSQKISEPHPSVDPVDFFGKFDPAHRIYRLPAVIDVNLWDSRNKSFDGMLPSDVLSKSIDFGFKNWGFAVVTIEPQNFMDIDGSVNETRIHMLGEMINISKGKGTPTTFEKLYAENYVTLH